MAPQHPPAAGSGIDHAAIDALSNRAITGMLIAAGNAKTLPNLVHFDFWKSYLKALQDVRSGSGSTLAGMDETRSGYQPPSHLQAAFTTLAKRAESATFAEVQQILAAQCVQVASEPVANSQIDAGQQLEDGVVSVVNMHNKHAPAGVNGNDGALHGAAPGGLNAATVDQAGGAA